MPCACTFIQISLMFCNIQFQIQARGFHTDSGCFASLAIYYARYFNYLFFGLFCFSIQRACAPLLFWPKGTHRFSYYHQYPFQLQPYPLINRLFSLYFGIFPPFSLLTWVASYLFHKIISQLPWIFSCSSS